MTLRYYAVHHDEEPGGVAGGTLPATSFIRDRFYCCRDVRRFTRRTVPKVRIRPTVYYLRSTAQMRSWVDALCAQWNEEDEVC
jgi:hypothetical protein